MRGRDGVRAGAGAGSSLDFLDFREYRPGDDLRRIDWSVMARTDREMIRLYREEVLPKLDIALDVSPSMAAQSAAALELCAGLAAAARNAGAAATLWHFDHAAGSFSLEDGPGTLRRNSIRVLVSDLLWTDEPSRTLHPFTDGAAACFVLQHMLAADENPPERGPHRLVDSETGENVEVMIDDASAAGYRAALAAHRARWADACRSFGASFLRLNETEGLAPLARAGMLEAL